MTGRPTSPADPDELRDVQALSRFDTFLFTAVATVLVTRTLLAVTGYPQVGSGGLHIAHVLYGGLLMGIAIVLVEVLPGTRVRVRAALIGGVGFGLFIDEIGKFLTKDVDYFFKPAVALMYVVFVVAYLGVRTWLQRRKLNDWRRLSLASSAVADLALGQLDEVGRNYAMRLLDGVDATGELREAADGVRRALAAEVPVRNGIESWLGRRRDAMESRTERALASSVGDRLVVGVFALQAFGIAVDLAVSLAYPGTAHVLTTALDTVLPSAVASVLVVAGYLRLRGGHRRAALGLLRVSVVVEMLVTQIVVFNRQQWLGLAGFAVDLLVLGALRLADQADEHGYRAAAGG